MEAESKLTEMKQRVKMIGGALLGQLILSVLISMLVGIGFSVWIGFKAGMNGDASGLENIQVPTLVTTLSLLLSMLIANTLPFKRAASKLQITKATLFRQVNIKVKPMCLALLAVLGVNALGQLINSLFEVVFNSFGLTSTTVGLYTSGGIEDLLMLLCVVILAPLTEEYIFRGVILNGLKPYGPRFAILTSSLLFGLIHGNLLQGIGAAFMGVIFAYVTYETGSIGPAIGLHMFNNLVALLIDSLWLSNTIYYIGCAVLAVLGVGIVLYQKENWLKIKDEEDYKGLRLKALSHSISLWIVVIVYVFMYVTYIKPLG